MKKMFQRIMVSSIYTAKNNGVISDIWKFTSVFYFALASCSYLVFLYLVLNKFVLNGALMVFKLNLVSHSGYNFVLNLVIYCIAPIMALDYWLVIHGGQYKKLMKRYPNYCNKKAFGWYFMLAVAAMYGSLFL